MLSNLPYHVRFWITLALTVVLSALAGYFLKKRFPGRWPGRKVTLLSALAAGLFLWGAWDLWTYVTVGRETAAYYGLGIIRQLAQNDLVQGAVKFLLGGAALLADWRRIREKKPLTSLRAITGLLALMALGLWGVSMALITTVAAEYGAYQILAANARLNTVLPDLLEFNLERRSPLSNGREIAFWDTISVSGPDLHTYSWPYDDRFLHLWEDTDIYFTTAVYDNEGNLLACSWEDSLYLQYMTEAEWNAGEEMGKHQAIAYLDQAYLTEEVKEDTAWSGLGTRVLRLTGRFDGSSFLPVRIEGVLYEDVQKVLWERSSGRYILADLIEDYDLPWYLLYEDTEAMGEKAENVTIYADYMQDNWREDSPAFRYKGQTYPDLAALAEELGPTLAEATPQNLTQYQRQDLVQVSVSYRMRSGEENYWSSYHYGEDAYLENAPEVQYYLVRTIYASPVWDAMLSLRKVYLFTLILTAALVLFVRSSIRKRLLQPAADVAEAMEEGWKKGVYRPDTPPSLWREAAALTTGYTAEQDWRRMKDNEITRLNTALTYARTAEENRRQMTSHIAHELKTPLAVVHSYAEGLKEHIAENKRDKYIDVILSETERMDAMVLEMLDLSRLEAGKVKLARDQFSLEKLARSVFDRLEMALEAKELHLSYDFPKDTAVTADEGRIAQVVENFATNAVKYTPPGGNIAVSITRDHRGTTFTVANDCPPLPQEALDKVWDTFYRVDEARSGGGTGLGLAIAKRIIDLHGGKCAAENTKTGVAFRFTL